MSTNDKKKKRIRVILIIIAVLIIVRAVLPYFVLRYANKTLAEMDGYYGHVEDIDLSLYRGAYQLNDIFINKVDDKTDKQTDFFRSKVVDLSIEWRALFRGAIVGELLFETPVLTFTKDKADPGEVAGDTSDFRKVLKGFMPLKINRFQIRNGSIHYVDQTAKPEVDLALKNVQVLAQNLTNSDKNESELPSPVKATASLYEGELTFNMQLNALAEQPAFDLNAELKNTNLVLLNDYLKVYGNFDINKGRFGLYTEFAAKQGSFTGYVKPLIKDLDVVGPEDKDDKFFDKVWEGVVGTAGVVFNNIKKDQVGTKVPIKGTFDDPSISTWQAIGQLIRNAFIQALMPAIDNQVNISSVDEEVNKDKRNLIQRIFTPKDKGKKEDKEGKGEK